MHLWHPSSSSSLHPFVPPSRLLRVAGETPYGLGPREVPSLGTKPGRRGPEPLRSNGPIPPRGSAMQGRREFLWKYGLGLSILLIVTCIGNLRTEEPLKQRVQTAYFIIPPYLNSSHYKLVIQNRQDNYAWFSMYANGSLIMDRTVLAGHEVINVPGNTLPIGVRLIRIEHYGSLTGNLVVSPQSKLKKIIEVPALWGA
jgi:hypothetical protein